MRPRMTFGVTTSALVLALFVSGCGGATPEKTGTPGATSAPEPLQQIDPATAATISGTISFDGQAPKPRVIKMNADPTCAKAHTGPTTLETLLVNDGKVQNVLVYVKAGVKGKYAPPSTPVVLDQKGCQYSPHVFGVMVGQPLEVVNSDPTLHNIHAMPRINREFNQGQPSPGMSFRHTFSTGEVLVPIKCDVHGWMSAQGAVLEHPFFAVSGKDGSFTITGLPAGTYTLEAVHELLGTQTLEVTVSAREARTADFSFTPAQPAS